MIMHFVGEWLLPRLYARYVGRYILQIIIEIQSCAIGYLLTEADLWRTILLCLAHKLVAKLHL